MSETAPPMGGNFQKKSEIKEAIPTIVLNRIPRDLLAEKIFEAVVASTGVIERAKNQNVTNGDMITEKVVITLDTAPNTAPEIYSELNILANKANFATELKAALKDHIAKLNLTDQSYNVKKLSSNFHVLHEKDKEKELGKRELKDFSDRVVI